MANKLAVDQLYKHADMLDSIGELLSKDGKAGKHMGAIEYMRDMKTQARKLRKSAYYLDGCREVEEG